ncbi:hypothetical protein BDR22DRAFT_583463 [Usnea florida]
MTEQGIKQAMGKFERGEVAYRAVVLPKVADSVTKPPIEEFAGKTPVVKVAIHKAQRAMKILFLRLQGSEPLPPCISILGVNLTVVSSAELASAEQQYLYALSLLVEQRIEYPT